MSKISDTDKIDLLICYIEADSAQELFGLAEELADHELMWLYQVTKCEGLGIEIDTRKGKS